MKNRLLILITLLISVASIAQNGINYKAVIKDANGEIISNQAITVQFQILEDGTTNVYQETHNPTTGATGIVVLNIGEGTVDSGNFSTIDWGAAAHSLNVQVDTGSGLVDLGTTLFNTVPYAKVAENVSGLEKITENGNTGWRLVGKNPDNFGDIGDDAIDLSIGTPLNLGGATGINSFAFGNRTTASGIRATAFGLNTTASGTNATAFGISTTASGSQATAFGVSTEALESGATAFGFNTRASGTNDTAFGFNTTASGGNATAFGDSTTASGDNSFAIVEGSIASGRNSFASGYFTAAESYNAIALGSFNIGGGNPDDWIETDPLIEIGNAEFGPRSNALTILKNGTITAPSFDIAEITDDKALITKEYFEAVDTKGLEQITEGGNTGFRLVGKNPTQYGDIGNNAVDLSNSIGSDTDHGATGDRSLALGASTIASGGNSMAMGFESEASGGNSMAIGYRTKADANSCLAIGVNNIGGGNPLQLTATDPIFEIGNGSPTISSNALTVLKNGNVGIGKHTGIDGLLEIEGNSSSTAPQLALIEDNSGFARFRFKNINRNGDDYWDIAGFIGTNVADDRLNFFNSDGGNILSLEGNGDATLQGSLTQNSDRRLKRDIETIDYGIDEILKLNPVQYNWKNKKDKTFKSLGVIAQEIEKIIPNVVKTGNDEEKTLSVSYIELIPVLIKAIQEQQELITKQHQELGALSAEMSEMKAMNQRLIVLEKLIKKSNVDVSSPIVK